MVALCPVSVSAEEFEDAGEAEIVFSAEKTPVMAAVQGQISGRWLHDGKGWWYRYGDGSYPRNQWALLGGKWYCFDQAGYMRTGWVGYGGRWYLLGADGAMVTGWRKTGGTWYYFEASGAMKSGWQKYGGDWYYLGPDGAMVTSVCTIIGGCLYTFDTSGRMTSETDALMKEEEIWQFLVDWLGNSYGAAGLMGNLFAESGLRSDNLENSFNMLYGVTDEQYTFEVDLGSRDFIDSAGYGLAQWTYHTRKQELLAFARSQGTSVGDSRMQMRFIQMEIERNPALAATLRNAASVREASDAVLLIYERPADQGDAVKERRAGYGQSFYDRFAG